jgi:probable F420-dependent oxidoreductase
VKTGDFVKAAGAPQLSIGIRNFAAVRPSDWRHVLDQARAADDAGIDRVYVGDHLVFGPDLSAYGDAAAGGVAGGVQPTGPDGEWLEPLTVLGAMAAVTSRVRLATNVLVAPLRAAVVVAKVATTLDALSGGRFELGVGIGWQEAEYRAAGVPFGDRGRILDETLAACRDLWTSERASFVGRGFSLSGVHMMPKPTDPAGVPVWVSGRAIPAVARRVAAFGAGWIPWGTTPEDFLPTLARMRALVEAEGGDFAAVQVSYPVPTAVTKSRELDFDRMFDPVPVLLRHGITDFRTMVRLPHGYDPAFRLLTEMRERFAQLVNLPAMSYRARYAGR